MINQPSSVGIGFALGNRGEELFLCRNVIFDSPCGKVALGPVLFAGERLKPAGQIGGQTDA